MEPIVLLSIVCFLLILSEGVVLYKTRGFTMPLTKKGEKIKKELVKEYGKKKGTSILYAMENKGTAKGITKKTAKKATKKATKKTTKKK